MLGLSGYLLSELGVIAHEPVLTVRLEIIPVSYGYDVKLQSTPDIGLEKERLQSIITSDPEFRTYIPFLRAGQVYTFIVGITGVTPLLHLLYFHKSEKKLMSISLSEDQQRVQQYFQRLIGSHMRDLHTELQRLLIQLRSPSLLARLQERVRAASLASMRRSFEANWDGVSLIDRSFAMISADDRTRHFAPNLIVIRLHGLQSHHPFFELVRQLITAAAEQMLPDIEREQFDVIHQQLLRSTRLIEQAQKRKIP